MADLFPGRTAPAEPPPVPTVAEREQYAAAWSQWLTLLKGEEK